MAEKNNAGDSLLQCYNISCGKMYRDDENVDGSCVHHPGRPYFHDGYKEWTCCKMRSRDFTIFMGFQGCTKGLHSNIKPEPPEPESKTEIGKEDIFNNGSVEKKNQQPEKLFVLPDPGLVKEITVVEAPNLDSVVPEKSLIICKNCKQEESALKMNEACVYHQGIQIFHDAYKYWSCCPNKKFSDFEDFQKLPPCAKADSHQLIAKIDWKENWFQTGGTLTIALYGLKGARLQPSNINNSGQKSRVILHGGRRLEAQIINQNGLTIFEKHWQLLDYVVVEGSKCTLNKANVQIVLQKVNAKSHWSSLVVKDQPGQQQPSS